MDIGTVIRQKRHRLGLSLRDVASVAHVHHASIDRIEKGMVEVISPHIVIGLADALHFDSLYLLTLAGAGCPDADVRIINRARKRMSAEQKAKMLKLLMVVFPDEFREAMSDDLDEVNLCNQK